jgi:dGTPase
MSHDLTRDHPDPLSDLLPPLALDRQRIVQSAAFRRLQHKTQVFVAPESDHFRTRLTHTLEVAHQARCLAGLLGLNADLAEVVALAHDLGHPPFGHAGEKALNECLHETGGFEHNRHTLRIVEELEHPYPDFRGLNLTLAVRTCLAHHATPFDQAGAHPLRRAEPPPESRVVDLADRLTYALHDLQDALYANLLTVEQLAQASLWRAAYTDPPPRGPNAWRGYLRPAIDRIQRRVLEDAARHAPIATLSPEVEAQLAELEQLLLTKVYRSEPLVRADDHARRILAALFDAYCAHPNQLPERFHTRLRTDPAHRVVTDYVAGMTDRYCVQDLARLSDLEPDS